MRLIAPALCAGVGISLLVFSQGCSRSSGGGGGSSVSGSTTAPSTSATSSTAPGSNTRIEYLDWSIEEQYQPSDMIALLNQTIGATSGNAATSLPLRRGLYLTATPQGANVLLRLDADGAGARPLDSYVEVAVPNDLAGMFTQFCQASMAVASLTSATPGLAAPWNLFLHAESPTGGVCEVGCSGDANGVFTLSWRFTAPVRAIASFSAPAAFGPPGNEGATAKIGGTVHFPISRDDFKAFVNQAYGYNAPQRFSDFALVPHTWLHLTVTADSTGKVVNVHFDAVTTSGARLYVAEAPASTDVGGRFYDETLARMQEMLDQEAAQPGSSKVWGLSYYYADTTKGVVDVVVKGVKGLFDIAYAVETPLFQVKP
jgi:hypothetical protein